MNEKKERTKRVIELIKVLGISPSRFATMIGANRQTCYNLYNGKHSASEDFLDLVIKSKSVNVNPNWLMKGEGDRFLSSEMNQLRPPVEMSDLEKKNEDLQRQLELTVLENERLKELLGAQTKIIESKNELIDMYRKQKPAGAEN